MYGAPFPNFVTHGFLRSPDGSFTTVDFPGASVTEVLAINPAGAIVGEIFLTRFRVTTASFELPT